MCRECGETWYHKTYRYWDDYGTVIGCDECVKSMSWHPLYEMGFDKCPVCGMEEPAEYFVVINTGEVLGCPECICEKDDESEEVLEEYDRQRRRDEDDWSRGTPYARGL